MENGGGGRGVEIVKEVSQRSTIDGSALTLSLLSSRAPESTSSLTTSVWPLLEA